MPQIWVIKEISVTYDARQYAGFLDRRFECMPGRQSSNEQIKETTVLRKAAFLAIFALIGGAAVAREVNTGLSCCTSHTCCHDGAKCLINHTEAFINCRPPVCK